MRKRIYKCRIFQKRNVSPIYTKKHKANKERKNNMYFDKYLNFVKDITNDDSFTKKQKDEAIDELQETIIKIAIFSYNVTDTKLGTSEYNTRKKYDSMIDETYNAILLLNDRYNTRYGESLIRVDKKSPAKMFDISFQIFNEMQREE